MTFLWKSEFFFEFIPAALGAVKAPFDARANAPRLGIAPPYALANPGAVNPRPNGGITPGVVANPFTAKLAFV